VKTLIAISALLLSASVFIIVLCIAPALAAMIFWIGGALAIGIVLICAGLFLRFGGDKIANIIEARATADVLRMEASRDYPQYLLEKKR
jgi:enhancing lycopene biosynthesis protein 2